MPNKRKSESKDRDRKHIDSGEHASNATKMENSPFNEFHQKTHFRLPIATQDFHSLKLDLTKSF